MKATKRGSTGAKPSVKKSRKALRKAKRLDKKAKRNEYYTNRNKTRSSTGSKPLQSQDIKLLKPEKTGNQIKSIYQDVAPIISNSHNQVPLAKCVEKEKKVTKELKVEMQKRRNRQMIEANLEEDKNIKQLERQLKLNKRKTKAIPKTFTTDGLDYLLEVCDSTNRQNVIGNEMDVDDENDDFDEDFHLMMDSGHQKSKKHNTKNKATESGSDSDLNKEIEEEDDDDVKKGMFDMDEEEMDENEEYDSDESNEDEKETLNTENMTHSVEDSINDSDEQEDEDKSDAESGACENKFKENTWEDIYGRLRDQDGNVIQHKDNNKGTVNKYVPPAVRAQAAGANQASIRLQRQLKGLINRLAEGNMHSISSQIEALYNSNSRHDMNETLGKVVFDNILVSTPCPERLLLENVLLVTILHANVGSEVGAYFLQTVVQKFYNILLQENSVEDKRMDNAVNFIAQMYNFKLFYSQLIYEVVTRLSDKFEEKHVECILNVLRNVGFTLRRDDPILLKTMIQSLQAKAASDISNNNPRVKFMLDVLLAIKNNNVNKIPNYDTTYSEHLKKISKSFIRKGNYVTSLHITMDDLLKADEQGKWWVVGSAWTGKRDDMHIDMPSTPKNTYSQKLVALAKKQHMNTDTRMNIFCVLMSAEDYMDAFEKLLHLGLKNQQEREIINVLLHCCLSEKVYNPYYSLLAQKFCDHDRNFQMIIKCSIWDKLQTLVDCSPAQISHLAKLLTHLFLEKGLPISTLKIVNFGELDKVTLRFMRQILLGVVLAPDMEQCQEVFLKVCQSDKLKMFRESLRLFIHHFLLRNLYKDGASKMDGDQKRVLEDRARMLDKLLSTNERKRKLV